MSRTKLIIAAILISLTLTGCQKSTPESDDSIIYNSSIYNAFVDSPRYIFGNINISLKCSTTIIEDKATGKVRSFIRDPFYRDMENISHVSSIQIDTKNNKGYYIDDSEKDNIAGFSIMQFDLNTFNKKEIYSESFIRHKEVFLGLSEVSDINISKENDFSSERSSNMADLTKRPRYFVDNNSLYLIKKDGIHKIDLKSNKQNILLKEKGLDRIGSVSYDGLNVYYINNTYELYKYSIQKREKIKLTDNKTNYSFITNSKIIYTNLNDKRHIYIMNKDGSNNHKIANNCAKNLNFDNDYIYYSNDDDKQCLYRMKYDGSENEKMIDKPTYFIFTFNNYNKLYIWSDDNISRSIKPFSVDKKDFTVKLLDFKLNKY